VAEQHRRWWSEALKTLPAQNTFVQPKNRGTAHGIMLALLQIKRRAPNSVVIFLPADHYLTDEATMARSLRTAANLAADNEGLVYLLGAEPSPSAPGARYLDLASSQRQMRLPQAS
jgi:mannose-1-phosphate guanylyltransferase